MRGVNPAHPLTGNHLLVITAQEQAAGNDESITPTLSLRYGLQLALKFVEGDGVVEAMMSAILLLKSLSSFSGD
jgi:hypothetical protein